MQETARLYPYHAEIPDSVYIIVKAVFLQEGGMPYMSSDVGGEKGRQESNIDWLDDIKIFRKHYDCLNCLYKDQYRTCFELQKCNMVDYPDVGCIGIQEAEDCRTCSYGNAAGTCFGYCIKAILHEHRIKRLKNGGF